MNTLYFGDNLDWLEGMGARSVDMVYLDPPFNSQATYNVLYRSPSGEQSAQYKAFEDTWRWGLAADRAFKHVQQSGSPAFDILVALNNFMQKSDLMAYLTMMAARLLELRRVLKPSGSLFLHCDAGASHYLKIILDQIFGAGSFRNEIIWRRSTGKSLMTRRLPTNHDVILLYSGDEAVWDGKHAFAAYDADNLPPKVAAKYVHQDPSGRRYQLDNLINPNQNRPNLTYEFLGVTRVWRWDPHPSSCCTGSGNQQAAISRRRWPDRQCTLKSGRQHLKWLKRGFWMSRSSRRCTVQRVNCRSGLWPLPRPARDGDRLSGGDLGIGRSLKSCLESLDEY